jgi:tRNA(fMet)-specific endonuclease VapC
VTAGVLDTSAYSAFMRGHGELKLTLQRADRIVLTPIVLGELGAGFRAGSHQKKNEAELSHFLSSPRVDVVAVDAETAERYAVILHGLRQAGTPIPTNDIWIAASAMQHGLRVLTTDLHYDRIPQIIVERYETNAG